MKLAVTVAARRARWASSCRRLGVGQIGGRFPVDPLSWHDLMTFTYEREVFLPMALGYWDFDAEVFQASTRIEWQVCDEICIPGEAEFAISLPISSTLKQILRWVGAFAETRGLASDSEGKHELVAEFNDHDGKVNVMIAMTLFTDIDEAWFSGGTSHHALRTIRSCWTVAESDINRTAPPYDDSRNDCGLLSVRATMVNCGLLNFYRAQFRDQKDPVLKSGYCPRPPTLCRVKLPGWRSGSTRRALAHLLENGGDSGDFCYHGMAGSKGTQVGEQWPAPHWLPFYETDLVNFGYEQEVVLPFANPLPTDWRRPGG